MKCKSIDDKISAYIDGELSPEEEAIVTEHIKECSQCSLAFEELKKTVSHVRNIDEVEPPPWLTHKIMANVREEFEQKKGLMQKLFFPLRIKIPIQAAATLAICVVAFLVFKTIGPELRRTQTILTKEGVTHLESDKALNEKVAKSPVIKKDYEEPADSAPEPPARKQKDTVADVEEESIPPGSAAFFSTRPKEKAVTEAMKQSDRLSEEKEIHQNQSPSFGTAGLSREGQPGIEQPEHTFSDYRRYSAESPGITRGRSTVEDLTKAFKDDDRLVRLNAIQALGALKNKQAVETLIQALTDPDAEVRSKAAQVLGEIKDRRAVEPLILALKDDSAPVRRSAALALGRIGDTRAVGPLTDALLDADASVRDTADQSLYYINKSDDLH